MGFLKDMLKTAIKVVVAPIYVPLKIAEELQKPSRYEYWYHDAGQGEKSDCLTGEDEQVFWTYQGDE